jgi:hypothetical protein
MPFLVIVVVTVVRGVMVPFVGKVDMVAVGDGVMPAAVAMGVRVVVVGDVGQRVLVVVVAVDGVRVPLVNVVGVIRVLRARVPAGGSVVVDVVGVNLVPRACHCSSVL